MAQAKIGELKKGMEFAGVLWLVTGGVRKTRNGNPYWEGTFQDATGGVSTKLWDSADGVKDRVKAMEGVLVPGRAVRISARVDEFQGALQFILHSAETVPEEDVDPAFFAPCSKRTRADMEQELDGLIAAMEDADYRRLMQAFREDADVFRRFAGGPAAKAIHHAWVGGLLEHSLSLARGAMALAPNYPEMNADLLLCACFFHDVGKTLEISSDPGFEYTTDGKLMGHIYMGARLVEKLCDSIPGFPEEKRRHIVHIVLSHQGERSEGFGSAADPSTPEAVFFHHLDNLDAKVQNCLTQLEKSGEAGEEGDFTPPRNSFIRKAYYRVRPDGATAGSKGGEREEQGASEDSDGPDTQPGLWR